MSSLQVRELPETVYRQLKRRAEEDHRSIAQEAIAILAKGLDVSSSPKARRVQLLQEIAQESKPNAALDTLDPVTLIREDRDR